MARPRQTRWLTTRGARLVNGLILAFLGILLAMPFPPLPPLTNTLPCYSIILLSTAMMEEDGVLVWVAYAVTLGTAIYLALVAGAIVDRADKRLLLLGVTWLLAALAAATAVLVHLDIVEVWHLAVVGMVQGAAVAFNFPTRSALIPALVAEKHVLNAVAMNSMGLNLNRVAVPAAAGLLLAWEPVPQFQTTREWIEFDREGALDTL